MAEPIWEAYTALIDLVNAYEDHANEMLRANENPWAHCPGLIPFPELDLAREVLARLAPLPNACLTCGSSDCCDGCVHAKDRGE